MLIQRILQLLLIAIVVVVAFTLLAFVMQMVGWLFWIAVKVLVVLLVVAALLRFVEILRSKQR